MLCSGVRVQGRNSSAVSFLSWTGMKEEAGLISDENAPLKPLKGDGMPRPLGDTPSWFLGVFELFILPVLGLTGLSPP